MKPLETEDAGWVDDMASSIRELMELAQFLEREIGVMDERYGRNVGPRIWGSNSDAADAMSYAAYATDWEGIYRCRTSRHYSKVKDALGKAGWALREYRERIG